MIDVTFEQDKVFECDFTSDDHMDVSMDAQTVTDVKVNGTSVVDDKGVANVPVPTTAEEVHALSDTTNIPSKTSELLNDSGFITEDDIPPLVTDLGYIDPEQYEEDVSIYQRSGAYSNGVITWGDWYKYGGEVFTP